MPDPQLPDIGAIELARALIGAAFLVRGCGGVIVETEAYTASDPASHSFRGPNPRNLAMFGTRGDLYVYRSYGIHLCLNIVARAGEAVLLRAIEPQVGIDVMAARRQGRLPIASGPGRLAKALGITPEDNGRPIDQKAIILTLNPLPDTQILTGPRIGISRAVDYPWRFGLQGSPYLSRRFP